MSLEFSRTRDYALLQSMATHPKLWPHVSDDFSGRPEDWQPIKDEALLYVLAKDGEEVLGFFLLAPHSPVLWEIHSVILPSAWGPRALRALEGAIRWLWQTTSAQRLITNVPVYNRLAVRLGERAGMTEYGRNPGSYQKDGVLHTQILLGISRPPCQ